MNASAKRTNTTSDVAAGVRHWLTKEYVSVLLTAGGSKDLPIANKQEA